MKKLLNSLADRIEKMLEFKINPFDIEMMRFIEAGTTLSGADIHRAFERVLKRDVSIGHMYSRLTPLEEEGYLTSTMSDEDSELRGGRRKRLFSLTDKGREALKEYPSVLGRA